MLGSFDFLYIHHTNEFKQCCHVGNTTQQCRLGLFQTSDFAGDLEDSKSTSGGILCIYESRTFIPVSWMCKKQTAVSHRSTESTITSLDAGLRMDGISALDLWDSVMEVLHSSFQPKTGTPRASAVKLAASQPIEQTHQHPNQDSNSTQCNVDYVSSNVKLSRSGAMFHIFEDDEAVIEMIIKGRSPTMRHVSRTHRVALDCFFFTVSTWTQKSKSNTSTPKTNSQTY